MKNVFIRNNHYQFRVNVPKYAESYFSGKSLLIKSMKTKNKSIALKFSKILMKKFQYILESIKMNLSYDDIQNLIYEFTNLRFEDTENDLYNSPNPENTLFYFMLEDTIAGYQDALINKNYAIVRKDLKSIVKQMDLNASEIETISHMIIESHINNLKQLKLNIENKKYANPKKTKIVAKNKFGDKFDEFIKNTSIKDQWKTDIINTVEMIKNILFLYFDCQAKRRTGQFMM